MTSFRNKDVVITGGTGSFGHQMTDRLLESDINKITLITNSEEEIVEMERTHPHDQIEFVNADIRDRERMFEVIKGDFVFHAGALKVIPFYEQYPIEAIRTNVYGTKNVKDACIRNHVSKAVFISTDKAVKPINVYGMTKALGEKIWQSQNNQTSFVTVRYGNVLNSRGSVIPFWKSCIERDEPLPITDKRMSRFHLTLGQAIELVCHAVSDPIPTGSILVPVIPASNILVMANALAGEEYPVKEIGIRPGEKLVETLISENETSKATYIKTETSSIGHYLISSNQIIDLLRKEMFFESRKELTSETANQISANDLRDLFLKEGII